MQNYKIVASYDGTDFSGWQRQPDRRTIQGEFESALARLAGRKVNVVGAGRTDAGVHALGQTANFKAALRLGDAELFKALNAILPASIRITSLERVSPDFHARRDARSKTYQYRIRTGRDLGPFDVRYVLHWPYPLNIARMRQAARLFVRRGDFSGFSSNRELHPVRTVTRSEIVKKGPELVYTIEAEGFLRYMVRTIVGTLLEVGRGRIGPEVVEEIFAEAKRTLRSPTAPAKGLCLLRVEYAETPVQETTSPDNSRPRTRASSSGLT
jgi:tRNA pseudouridine38-40 synthase